MNPNSRQLHGDDKINKAAKLYMAWNNVDVFIVSSPQLSPAFDIKLS